MIDIENIKTEHIVALVLAVLGFVCGALVFNVSHESECAGEIVKMVKLQLENDKQRKMIQRLKATKTGGVVIDCQSVCAKQVKSALEKAKAWECED